MSVAVAGKVGPNALIQLGAALRDACGPVQERRLFAEAGLATRCDHPPETMINEQEATALFHAVTGAFPPAAADALLRDAGRRTAEYVMQHRIPRLARGFLKFSPTAIAGPLLLSAIKRNAWTFAGSGVVTTRKERGVFIVEIASNPLATPGCPWHQGVFERLFGALVAPQFRVTHPRCCAEGAKTCVFEISSVY